MTARAAWLLTGCALAGAALLLALGAARVRAASIDAGAARARHAQVVRDTGRLLELRGTKPTVSAREQPTQDVYRRVNETLVGAGLRTVQAQHVVPAGDRAVADDPTRREQTVQIELAPITLDELGAFLARWRADQTIWTISQIDMALHGAETGTYRATLGAVARYAIDRRPASPPE